MAVAIMFYVFLFIFIVYSAIEEYILEPRRMKARIAQVMWPDIKG